MRDFARRVFLTTAAFLLPLIAETSRSQAADWPAWRGDAGRTATTDEVLPEKLQLQWWRQYPALTPAWPEDPRIQFDANYEPIVVGGTMYVGSSHNDSVTALDTRTGRDKWKFYAEGPVRFAPLAAEGRVYFGSDDGFFYCIDGTNGKLVWKFQAAPTNRKVLGNDRLSSVWPIRGGAVLVDGTIWFTTGIWPFEGTFLYGLDVATGAPLAKQPASPTMKTLNDRSPQGYLVAAGSRVYTPCGRSVSLCLDAATNQFVGLSYNTRETTDYHLSAIGPWLFHGMECYNTQTKKTIAASVKRPVLTDGALFAGKDSTVTAYDLTNPKVTETKDRRGKVVKKTIFNRLWTVKADSLRVIPQGNDPHKWVQEHPVRVSVKAGNRLYGFQDSTIFAIDLPQGDADAKISWNTQIEGTPASMLVADGRLFVVTLEGRIYSFGAPSGKVQQHVARITVPVGTTASAPKAETIRKASGQGKRFVIVDGIGNGNVIAELVKDEDVRVVGVDADTRKVKAVRQRFDADGLYGKRVVLLSGSVRDLGLPPYLARAYVADGDSASQDVSAIFDTLRPYGGVALVSSTQQQHDALSKQVAALKLPSAEVTRENGQTLLRRVGRLPGSADWGHEYGDASNTLMSQDQLVRAPLGLLWYGGPSASGELFYDRHRWGPSLLVTGGRMFIQGPQKLTAVDVYTGQILWQIPMPDGMSAGRRGNWVDIGFHVLAVEDAIYLAYQKECLKIDPATGKTLATLKVPTDDAEWGRVRVVGELLIGTLFRKTKDYGNAPVEIVALDRYSGEQIWSKKAKLTFPIVTVSNGRIYCFDGVLEKYYKDWDRKGLIPKASEQKLLLALDTQTGKELWSYTTDIITTWLSYSDDHDVLMVTNKNTVAAFRGKDGKELWRNYNEAKGFKGHPETLWDRVIVWGDSILDQRGPGLAYDINTGERMKRTNPLTGGEAEWEFTKAGHHCNYAIASPHLMTFRAHDAGFCDIASGNTSRLSGFRSGCRNSLIPADGILNSPNYAHGCSCGYSLFTSLAFRHLPQSEVWSYSALKVDGKKDRLTRVGINLGAPGDRQSDEGTLWIDYPNKGGPSPAVAAKLDTEKPRWFHKHSAFVTGDGLKWVAGSGVEGLTKLTVTLDASANTDRKYKVRLFFLEPDALKPGQRVFDVALQDQTVLKGLDIAQEAGGTDRVAVKEFTGITAGKDLSVTLNPTKGKPLLSGVEIIEQVE